MPHLEVSDLVILLAQAALIIFASRSLGIATRWLGQPLVIAEVFAGILLGPSLLGWLFPEGMAALFPPNSLPTLKLLSQLGLVLFMFLIGLELDPKLLRGRTHTSVAISHSSIVLPFGLGALAALWLYESHSAPDVPFVSFVLFLGVSMSVTAFPVLARILSERQLLSSRVGAIAIACAAVDDVTAWCLLALVVAIARSEGIGAAAWTTGLALGFIVVMLLAVRPFLGRLGARVASRAGLTPTVVAGVFVLLIASSIVSELIGIHALFGAFLFGAIFPKDGKLAEGLIEKLESVSVVLFLPLFFAFSGLRTQIQLVSTPGEWALTGLFIVIATAGKFGGSAIAGRLTGLRWREASAVGILMNTRGLMELIVLNLGLDIGVISPKVFTMLVIMALVTTFATTPALRWVYPDSELAKDRVDEPPLLVPPGEPPPFTLLMCVSGREPDAGMAHVCAVLLGPPPREARVVALHLRGPSDRPSVEQRRPTAGEQEPLQAVLSRAQGLALDVQALEYVSTDVARDICRTAEAVLASVVLIGAHRPLLLEGTFGGTVKQVVNQAKCAVGVFVDRGSKRFENVLLTTVGEGSRAETTQLARRLQQTPGVRLTVLDAVGADASHAPAHASGPQSSPARVDETILQEAAKDYDLIVVSVGDEGEGAHASCQRIVTHSTASVLVFHCARVREPFEQGLTQLHPNLAQPAS